MARRPSNLSQAPIRLDIADGRGDVLGDVLSLGLLRNVLYKQIEARAPWGLDMQARNRAMLYLVARGQARLELEGQEPIVLDAEHVAFLPRGAAHVLRDSKTSSPSAVCDGTRGRPTSGTRRIGGRGARTSIIAAFFELERAAPPLLGRPSEVVVFSGNASTSDPLAAATIALVLAELERPGPASVLLLQRLADVLVVQAMRILTKQPACQARPQQGLVALSDPPIHDALSLMHAQVGHAWSVADLAARVGLSRSGFAARFTELVGEPPLQYLARWRVTRAAELLRDTSEPVSTIAARVGYESTPSFNKAFKRWQGTSPGAYRRAALSV
ncbi:MAG: Transcriptional regulator, AraC family [Labilithrix sp.]|nr:Transcriptional regulator, AraC family [Labilithrix sp.]